MTDAKPTYQELKAKLEDTLRQLQHEDTSIDEAIVLHAEGQKTLKQLQAYLANVAKDAKLVVKTKHTD